jgi:hypothetical protein
MTFTMTESDLKNKNWRYITTPARLLQFLLHGIEMTSDNVNIFSFGFGQLFNGCVIQICQYKRTLTSSPFIRFDRSRTIISLV